jgi:hypothetical protein
VLRGGLALLANESFKALELDTVIPAVYLSEQGLNAFRRLLSTESVGQPMSNALFIRNLLALSMDELNCSGSSNLSYDCKLGG